MTRDPINMLIERRIFPYAVITVLWSALFILLVVNPLWEKLDLHVPGESLTKVDFTQIVDSVFYVRNADLGYRWNLPTSIWFHPLVVWGINILPAFIATRYRLWLLSLFAGLLSITLVNEYVKETSFERISPWILLVIPIIPGGLGIATGNAEFPCLVFTSLLVLSVLRKEKWYLPLIWGALAILTKPNAVYMILGLCVYIFGRQNDDDSKVVRNSVLGIAGILIAWALWFTYVDIQANRFGSYWETRELAANVPLVKGFFDFMRNISRIVVYTDDYGQALKFLTALAVPLVDIWILQVIPLRSETHRLSILLTVMSMLAIALTTNNPNKIVVYSTTFPGHFAIGLLFLKQAFSFTGSNGWIVKLVRVSAGISYLMFCVLMAMFYIIGTPLMWYY